MEKGLIHLYYGDGKGKTTAAVGLGVRAYGKGFKVLFLQFLKDNNSGELSVLEGLGDNFKVLKAEPIKKFFFYMNVKEKETTIKQMNTLFDNATKIAALENYDLLIFDELIDAVNLEIIDVNNVLDFLRDKPEKLEVVITGHNPTQDFFDSSNYISEIKKIKHPYDSGIKARNGIEK